MRQTIEFEALKIGRFKAYTEPTVLETQQIENVAAEICGGGIELIKFRTEIAEFKNHVGKKDAIDKDVSNVLDMAVYLQAQERLNNIYKLATLEILCVDPCMKIRDVPPEKFELIYSAYEVALNSFRSEERGQTAAA